MEYLGLAAFLVCFGLIVFVFYRLLSFKEKNPHLARRINWGIGLTLAAIIIVPIVLHAWFLLNLSFFVALFLAYMWAADAHDGFGPPGPPWGM